MLIKIIATNFNSKTIACVSNIFLVKINKRISMIGLINEFKKEITDRI